MPSKQSLEEIWMMATRLGQLAALVVILCSTSVANAIPRSFVSTHGDDSGPCSIVAPCRTFNAAAAQTDPFGQIIAIDSGGFGALTITRSISIVAAPGVFAGITPPPNLPGITISAGPDDIVLLRGLTIEGGTNSQGIRILSASRVHIESCVLSVATGNIPGGGVVFVPSERMRLLVLDSIFRSSSLYAQAQTTQGALSNVYVSRSAFEWGAIEISDISNASITDTTIQAGGIDVAPIKEFSDSTVSIDRTSIVGGGNCVTAAAALTFFTDVSISNSSISGCATAVVAYYHGRIRLTATQLTGNARGVYNWEGLGTFYSTGDNVRANNVDDGDGVNAMSKF